MNAIKEFQNAFVFYFPRLTDPKVAASERRWLLDRINSPLETVKRSDAKKELRKVRASLRHLAGHDLSYWPTLQFDLWKAEVEKSDKVAQRAHQVLKFLLQLKEWGDAGELDDILTRYFKVARAAIQDVPERGNINFNWPAVNAVGRLRVFWWRNRGKVAPKALKPTSPFGHYMEDAFAYLKIDGKPVPAFRSWIKTCRDNETKYPLAHSPWAE
ncbi:hypothetical protein BH10PSE7_BH10PSE7_34010 [soil metagenome]